MTLKEIIQSKVNEDDIYRYLSAKSEVENDWKVYVDEVLTESVNLIAPVYASVRDAIILTPPFIELQNSAFKFASHQFSKHIEDASELIIVAATIGHAIERKIKYYFTTNPTRAIVMDACGSALIEAYCDTIEMELFENLKLPYAAFTSRFSPGYGDLSLELQRAIFETFDFSKKTGIHLSSGNLMLPQKSVVFLVADQKHKSKTDDLCLHKCGLCTLSHCIYRQEESTSVEK